MCLYSINIAWLTIWFYFVHREIGLRLWEAVLDLFPYAALAALAMVVTAFVTSPIENIYLLLGLKIFIAALLYGGLMWLFGSVTFKECISYLLNKKSQINPALFTYEIFSYFFIIFLPFTMYTPRGKLTCQSVSGTYVTM